ncbi:truC [Symbiodinium natans]|uniref:TruC protein n=1 Tax=Symbiodinium natans TaxID=878477 RepID=A0A812HQT9_9DINO|nr:truC [Symbiodinium natans]
MNLGAVLSTLDAASLWPRSLEAFALADRWADGEEPGELEQLLPQVGAEVLARGPGLVALDKPAGRSVQELIQPLEGFASLVSRLDLPTSGVLVVAAGGTDTDAFQAASAQFAGRLVDKEYVCLCRGQAPDVFANRTPLRKQRAHTDFELLGTFLAPASVSAQSAGEVYSLVQAKPKTGRKHQIRRHLAELGLPIVGDARYGSGHLAWCARLFLHCRQVSMRDQRGGLFLATSPLPAELTRALGWLEPVDA